MNQEYLLRGIRCLDPFLGLDEIRDFGIQDGKIVPPEALSKQAEVLEMAGKAVAPGFVDLHVHLREPGQTHKEDIVTGTRAAAAGGFTTILAMPNTVPAIDSVETYQAQQQKLAERSAIQVLQSAAFTLGRNGIQPSHIPALKAAGVPALTDDGSTPQDLSVMRQVMEQAVKYQLPVIDHCEDFSLSKPGVMHLGAVSDKLGYAGQPRRAEEAIVERDILLSRETGCPVHLQHLSSAGSVALLREAQREGLPVTGEVTPHHLFFTDAAVEKFDSNAKMAPPLREEADRQSLIEALCDGTISAVATDHAPHTLEEKAVGMLKAPFGIVGIEAAVPICLTLLYHTGRMPLLELIARFTVGPRKILGLPIATLQPGAEANLTILDLNAEHIIDVNTFQTKSKNCPYNGIPCKGRAAGIFYQGMPQFLQ